MMIVRIIQGLFLVLLMAMLIALLSFANQNNRQSHQQTPDIRIESSSGNLFILAEDILEMINSRQDTGTGNMTAQEQLQQLHQLVHSIPQVEQANIYRTISGEIRANISLRDPLVRVVNKQNQSFYIDTKGVMFPLTNKHTARVMVATGHIEETFAPGKRVESISQETSGGSALWDLFQVAKHIHEDEFWRAFIDHLYILPDGRIELTPKNGTPIIAIGKANQLEEKFGKLKVFYINGLPETGWQQYRRINIEYKNQVICSK